MDIVETERFTEMSWKVLRLAQDKARRLKHHYIGTEHILVGILRAEGGIGAKALTNLNVNLKQVRYEINNIMNTNQDAETDKTQKLDTIVKCFGCGKYFKGSSITKVKAIKVTEGEVYLCRKCEQTIENNLGLYCMCG